MNEELHVQPGAHDEFTALGLHDFDSVMTLRKGMPVSRHAHRNTVRLAAESGSADRTYYLKRVYRVPLKHIVEDLVARRPPRAQPVREAEAIERCREQGIGVMRALAWGQRSVVTVPRQAFLLVEAVPAMENLEEALRRLACAEGRDALRERSHLARALGRFVARIHDAGLLWPDMVAKHIYIAPRPRREASGGWQFYLIDVERLTTGRSRRRRRKDLERLWRSMQGRGLPATDLLRFAVSYLGMEDRPGPARRARLEEAFAWARDEIRRSWASQRPRLPLPDDAPRPEQQRFAKLGRVRVNEAFIPILQNNGLVSFSSVFGLEMGERLDKPRLADWRRRLRVPLRDVSGHPCLFYVKRYEDPPLREQLRRILTQHPKHGSAWWEWENIHTLSSGGIPTPTPVAFGEKMHGVFERRSFLVTQAIPGESLESWVPRHLGPQGDVGREARIALVELVARLARNLHRRRMVHRDLYLSHIFLSHNEDGRPVLRLIDLQRVFRPRWRWRRWQVKDLAALHYSTPWECVPATDRVRFLRRYLDVKKLGPQDKRLARRVLDKARRMARHNRPR